MATLPRLALALVAVASTDSRDARSSFSNYGYSTVHLGAPGSSIYSTMAGGSYQSLSGTSMATPHVSGALALGDFFEAASVVTLFAVAQWLESRTLERARAAIGALLSYLGWEVIRGRAGALLRTLVAWRPWFWLAGVAGTTGQLTFYMALHFIAVGPATVISASEVVLTTALGGMLVGTIFGVVIVPGLYFIFGKLSEGKALIREEDDLPLTEEMTHHV